jgi:hypothetical protein
MWSKTNYTSPEGLFIAMPTGEITGIYKIKPNVGATVGTFDCNTGRYKLTEGETSCLELKDLSELGNKLKAINK